MVITPSQFRRAKKCVFWSSSRIILGPALSRKESSDDQQLYRAALRVHRCCAEREVIVALHRHFGPNRHGCDGSAIEADASAPERKVDIVILAIRGHELTGELGLDAGTIDSRYVDLQNAAQLLSRLKRNRCSGSSGGNMIFIASWKTIPSFTIPHSSTS